MSTRDTQMNQYLTTIAEAVHGRDMRAAIHDGLEKTYNDAYTWYDESLGNANEALRKATDALNIAEPMGDDIQEVKDLAENLDTKYDETNERVNNIIAHNNDTDGNSELIDLRTTFDGQTKSSAGAAVRGQISALDSRIDNLVREQSTGELEDCHAKPVYVPLYENQTPVNAFAAQTLQLSLSGSPAPSLAKYAFIKITFKDSYLLGAGIRSVYIPNPGKDAEGTNAYTNDGYVVMPADGTYGLSSYARKFTAALSSNDTVLNIMFTDCEKIIADNPFAISGSDMTISDPSSTATTDNGYLIPYKIFLVDFVVDGEIDVDKDTELIDIRNGEDGTTYQSAGAAVRGQVVSAKNKTASTQSMIAPLYSVTGTYAVGDYVNYADKLYKAKQAISSESWTPSHWQEVNVMDEVDSDVGELKSALTDVNSSLEKTNIGNLVNTGDIVIGKVYPSGATGSTLVAENNPSWSIVKIQAKPNTYYSINSSTTPFGGSRTYFVKANMEAIIRVIDEAVTDGVYLSPPDTAFICMSINDTSLSDGIVIIEGNNSAIYTTDTTEYPYGGTYTFNKVNNLSALYNFNRGLDTITGGLVFKDSGEVISNGTTDFTDYIPVFPNCTYIAKGISIKFNSSIWEYDANKKPLRIIAGNSTDTECEFTVSALGAYVRMTTNTGNTPTIVCKDDIIRNAIAISKVYRDDALSGYLTFSNETRNGITYSWATDKQKVNIDGTTSEGSNGSYTWLIRKNQNLMPLIPGYAYYLNINIPVAALALSVSFYDEDSNIIKTKDYSKPGVLLVPDSAVIMTMRFVIYKENVEIDNVNVNTPTIVLYDNQDKYKDAPKIIIFKDDDTVDDTAVTRYHDNCRHNGIYGTYAVIARNLEQGYTDVDKLLEYEQEGFTTHLHCYSQGENDYWITHNDQLRREDVAKAIRLFRSWNFLNFMFFQVPGGNIDDGVITMLRDFGFTFNSGPARDADSSINYIETLERYNLRNFSLLPTDTQGRGMAEAKRVVDLLSKSNGGVVIITTHFANWTNLTYDETIDDNGYAVGYSRFNEIVQYALASGAVVTTVAEAEKILGQYFLENKQYYTIT